MASLPAELGYGLASIAGLYWEVWGLVQRVAEDQVVMLGMELQ